MTDATEFYIVDMRPEWKKNPYITLWRANDCGYTYPLPWAGKYARSAIKPGYHTSKRGSSQWVRFPVACSAVEALAFPVPQPGIVDGNVGPILLNRSEVRAALRAAAYLPTTMQQVPA